MEKRPPLHLGAVAIEKEAFWSPSMKVANFTFYLYVEFINKFKCKLMLLLFSW